MLNPEIPRGPVQRSRFTQVREWLAKQKELSDHIILVTIENNRLLIYSAVDGSRLATVDWTDKQIMIVESQNSGSPYKFSAFKKAVEFLDGMLTHYGVTAAEIRAKLAPLATLAG